MKPNIANRPFKSQIALTKQGGGRPLTGLFILIFLLFFCGARAGAQDRSVVSAPGGLLPQNTLGLPGVVHFTDKDFEAGVQNWMITQDSLGILYFANTDGLLTYNGHDWHLYPLPNKTLVRSLVIGAGGKIYTGGQDEIGYYFPAADGKLRYHSLKEYLPANKRRFADVWNAGIMGNRLYFRCTDRIMAIDTAKQGRKTVVYPAPSEWVFMACVKGKVFAQDRNQGLLKYQDGKWKTVWAAKAIKNQVITAILETGDKGYLITTLKGGAFILKAGNLRPLPLPSYIAAAHIYAAANINGSEFALGTTSGGVFIINTHGQVHRHFDSDTRLQNNNVLSLFVDREQNLWLGLDKGIDLVDYNSFIQTISPVYNTPAACYTALIYKNQLVIGTSDGLFKAPLHMATSADLSFSRGHFSKVAGSSGQVWGLYNTGDHLLMGHNEGIFQVDGARALPVYQHEGVWLFQPLPGADPHKGPWISGNYAGMELIKDSLGRIMDAGRIPGSPYESLRFMAMDPVQHVIWATHPYRGVYGLQMSPDMKTVLATRLYTQKDGLPGTLNNYVYTLKDRIVFCTDEGLYTYDSQRDRFYPDSLYQKIFGKMSVRMVTCDAKGRIWFVTHKKLGVYLPGKGIRYFPELTGKLISGFEFILPVNDQNILVGSNDGLIHINIDKYQKSHGQAHLLLTKVTAIAGADSTLFNGYFTKGGRVVNEQPEAMIGHLPARFNAFHFAYTVASYRPPREFEYSFQLEGFDKDWSSWTTKKEKDYTNLSYGSYTFKVKARDRFGVSSQVMTYQFVIEPHWYQTTLAYLIYTLLFFAGLIYGRSVMLKKFEAQRVRFEREQQQLRYLHQLEIEHSEREIIQLQKEKLEAEIAFKNQELASTTMHLFKRGKLLSKLKEELIGAIRKLPGDSRHGDFSKLVKMLIEAEKQDADWQQFAIHFDEVHNNFLSNIKEAYPELTPSDLKICAYIKMNLSSKEMAQLLNISLKGVEVARYRLRKKLSIPSAQTNLFDFLSSISKKGNT